MCGFQHGTIECTGHGYLWDADDEGYDPDDHSRPCPRCNTREFLTDAAEDARDGTSGCDMGRQYTGASAWRNMMDIAIRENAEVARQVLAEIGPVGTCDYADIEHPDWRNTVPCIVVPPTQP